MRDYKQFLDILQAMGDGDKTAVILSYLDWQKQLSTSPKSVDTTQMKEQMEAMINERFTTLAELFGNTKVFVQQQLETIQDFVNERLANIPTAQAPVPVDEIKAVIETAINGKIEMLHNRIEDMNTQVEITQAYVKQQLDAIDTVIENKCDIKCHDKLEQFKAENKPVEQPNTEDLKKVVETVLNERIETLQSNIEASVNDKLEQFKAENKPIPTRAAKKPDGKPNDTKVGEDVQVKIEDDTDDNVPVYLKQIRKEAARLKKENAARRELNEVVAHGSQEYILELIMPTEELKINDKIYHLIGQLDCGNYLVEDLENGKRYMQNRENVFELFEVEEVEEYVYRKK